MTNVLSHRGPDATGVFIAGSIGLGHCRLSIQDLSAMGAQPMELEAGGAVVAYNGEAYNFLQLRKELVALGHRFRGHSDTEVILHAYQTWGLDGLKRLEGIFSFALWDPSLQRLVLMRDRLGVKPLFFANGALGLCFGSEIKAVLAAGGIDRSLDDQAFSEYLWYGNTHQERTFFRGVRSLEPGHWLIAERGHRRIEPWWRIEEWLERMPPASFAEAVSEVRCALDIAVERQLVADVPVGIFLSGGVDSSAIAASAVHVQRQALLSYSASFDFEGGVNELPKARLVASRLGLDHHEVRIEGGELDQVLVRLCEAHDEPFADAANIPLYLLCRALEGRIKVVLQGDGGDELFAGYRRYAILQNSRIWRAWPRSLTPIVRRRGEAGRRLARLLEAIGSREAALRMALLLTMETLSDRPENLLTLERRRHLEETTDPFLAYRTAAERFRGRDPVQQMLLTDLTVQLPSQFLPKVDRASMAAGIEARVPLLDERVAELAVGLPSTWKTRRTEKKIVLRESQRERLPALILDGPKTGFGVPYQHWLRESLFEFTRERLLDGGFLSKFHFQRDLVEAALTDHRTRRRERGFTLWKLLQVALWNEYAH